MVQTTDWPEENSFSSRGASVTRPSRLSATPSKRPLMKSSQAVISQAVGDAHQTAWTQADVKQTMRLVNRREKDT